MTYTLQQFKAEYPDDAACLDRLMLERYGGAELTCPACDRRSRFEANPKRRAYSCRHCGHLVYPALGTPLQKAHRPLPEWMFARDLLARNPSAGARELQRELGCSASAARRMEAELRNAAETSGRGPRPALRPAAPPSSAGAGPGKGEHRRGSGKTDAPRRARSDLSPRGPAARTLDRPLAAERPGAATGARPGGNGATQPAATTAPHEQVRLVPVLAISLVICAALIGAVVWMGQPTERQVALDQAAAYPPMLTLAALNPSISLSPVVEALDEELAPPEAKPTVKLTRAPYERVIKELEAPGPRNPNEVLAFGPMKIRRHLVEMIVKAARVTSSDPVLLMAIADKESSFATEVQARTSSAMGLFQFIEKTWLKVVHDFGSKHGLEKDAKLIRWAGDELTVATPADRARILELRREPYLSALLAAEMLKRDRAIIARRIGRELTHGETYLVHFLGTEGAGRFMEQVVKEPTLAAADLLPRPAAANKPIFFRAGASAGQPPAALSVLEVHQKFEAMMGTRLTRYRNVQEVTGAITPTATAKR